MSQDTFDPLAGFAAEAGSPANAVADDAARALTELVERNPVPAVLAAAAAGAGLMALLALLARSDPPAAPRPISLAPQRRVDVETLKQQLADLSERVAAALPTAAAKQHIDATADALSAGWGAAREQAKAALGRLGRFEPQATAAVRAARENPVWTALVVGALGALLGSQLLGSGADPTEPDTDTAAP